MALLQKLKEKLGIGGGSGDRESGAESEVTVEREPAPGGEESADAEAAEGAVGDEAAADDGGAVDAEAADGATAADDDEAAAAETAAAASTESLVDEAEGDGAEGAAEPAEAAAGEADDVAVDDDDRGPSVEEIKGIGPAYAERLASIGIETVDDLAAADAEAVAEGTSVGEKRAATWIERAGEF